METVKVETDELGYARPCTVLEREDLVNGQPEKRQRLILNNNFANPPAPPTKIVPFVFYTKRTRKVKVPLGPPGKAPLDVLAAG